MSDENRNFMHFYKKLNNENKFIKHHKNHNKNGLYGKIYNGTTRYIAQSMHNDRVRRTRKMIKNARKKQPNMA